jgi:hypothetical protein
MAALLRDKLEQPKCYETYASVRYDDDDELMKSSSVSTNLRAKVVQLNSDIENNLPEALMSIISNLVLEQGSVNNKSSSSVTSVIRKMLRIASSPLTNDNLQPSSSQDNTQPKVETFDEALRNQYYAEFKVVLSKKLTVKTISKKDCNHSRYKIIMCMFFYSQKHTLDLTNDSSKPSRFT